MKRSFPEKRLSVHSQGKRAQTAGRRKKSESATSWKTRTRLKKKGVRVDKERAHSNKTEEVLQVDMYDVKAYKYLRGEWPVRRGRPIVDKAVD